MILIMAIYIFLSCPCVLTYFCFLYYMLTVQVVPMSSTGTPPIIMGQSVRSWVQDPLGAN
jgi:hypothetical protein